MCGNSSGSRPNFCGRQHLTFDKGRAWMPEVERPKFCRTQNKQSVHKARALCEARVFCPFTMVVGVERFGATGGASKARMP